jgi:hypothetical protein
MPANHKVSVAWQIVFTFLPVVNFWAFYRIRKLRKYLLYVFVPSTILSVGILTYYYSDPSYAKLGDDGAAFGQPNNIVPVTMINPVQIVRPFIPATIIGWGLQGFAVYLVIIWSRQHNRSFDTLPTQVNLDRKK